MPIVYQGPRYPGANPQGTDVRRFVQDLIATRPDVLNQQQQLLNTLGPSLRQAAFRASPELQQASQFIQQRFQDPLGGLGSEYAARIQQAQAARGFGGGGTGPSREEAKFLTALAEQSRLQLLPQAQAFGQQILGISGLGAPPDLTLAALGGLILQNRQFQSENQPIDIFSDFSPGGGGSFGSGGGGFAGGGSYGGTPGGGSGFYGYNPSGVPVNRYGVPIGQIGGGFSTGGRRPGGSYTTSGRNYGGTYVDQYGNETSTPVRLGGTPGPLPSPTGPTSSVGTGGQFNTGAIQGVVLISPDGQRRQQFSDPGDIAYFQSQGWQVQ